MKVIDIGDIAQLAIEAQFKWKIADFFSVTQDKNVKLYKSQSYNFGDIYFQFKLFPRSRPFPGFMNLSLISYDWPYYTKCSAIEYSYGFETRDNSVEKVVRGIVTENTKDSDPCIFKLSELHDRKSELAPSGVVTIFCKIKCNPSSSQPKIPEEPKSKKLKLDTLSENFKSLFVNKVGSDVTLQVMDKEYKAHSTVLMARSSVFAAMHLHETSPKQTNIITRRQKKKFQKMVVIPGGTKTDSESFELFLKYLYSGEVEELSTQTALHLYEISNKYMVWELRTLCMDFLIENLSVENLFDVCIFADKYHNFILFRATYDFFCRNIDKILNTSVWDSFVESNYLLSKKYYKGKLSEEKRARLLALSRNTIF